MSSLRYLVVALALLQAACSLQHATRIRDANGDALDERSDVSPDTDVLADAPDDQGGDGGDDGDVVPPDIGPDGLDGGVIWTADFLGLAAGPATTLPGGLMLQRASPATVQTSASTVAMTGINDNIARIGDDGVHHGLVIEETRTNLVVNARNLMAMGWTPLGAMVTAGYAAGPDGTPSTASRLQTAMGVLGQRAEVAAAIGEIFTGTAWTRQTTASAPSQVLLGWSGATADVVTLSTVWTRRAITRAADSTLIGMFVADGSNRMSLGGLPAGARDEVVDLCQIERGGFATEVIPTNGAPVARAGERLSQPMGAMLVSGGRLSLEVRLQPKGGRMAYAAPIRIWTAGSDYCEITPATGAITISIGGTTNVTTALDWRAGDTLELWIAAGQTATTARYRVGGAGPARDLTVTSGSALPPLSPAGALDLLCASDATRQFSAWVQRIAAYSASGVPDWAR